MESQTRWFHRTHTLDHNRFYYDSKIKTESSNLAKKTKNVS